MAVSGVEGVRRRTFLKSILTGTTLAAAPSLVGCASPDLFEYKSQFRGPRELFPRVNLSDARRRIGKNAIQFEDWRKFFVEHRDEIRRDKYGEAWKKSEAMLFEARSDPDAFYANSLDFLRRSEVSDIIQCAETIQEALLRGGNHPQLGVMFAVHLCDYLDTEMQKDVTSPDFETYVQTKRRVLLCTEEELFRLEEASGQMVDGVRSRERKAVQLLTFIADVQLEALRAHDLASAKPDFYNEVVSVLNPLLKTDAYNLNSQSAESEGRYYDYTKPRGERQYEAQLRIRGVAGSDLRPGYLKTLIDLARVGEFSLEAVTKEGKGLSNLVLGRCKNSPFGVDYQYLVEAPAFIRDAALDCGVAQAR